jgi:C4-dicarboxylate transporter DctM subunit
MLEFIIPWAFLIIILFFFLVGTPLFIVLGSSALFCIYWFSGEPLAVIFAEVYRLVSNPVLVSIPLFTFAGYIMAESKMPSRLVELNNALVGWIPGSITWVTIVSCALFTAFTGASGVTIVALGGLLLPALMKSGYSERLSMGLVTASGSLGLLFPPSIPVILYGFIAGVDIQEIFAAGIIPGIILMLVWGGYPLFTALNTKMKKEKFELRRIYRAVRGSLWEIPIPILILVGIYGGLATVTEVAAMTALYVVVAEVFIYRDLNINKLCEVTVDSIKMVGAILMILCMALAFSYFIVDYRIPYKVVAFIQQFTESKLVFLIILNCLLLIVGCFLDIFSAIMVVVPLITPIAAKFGINPVHLAIIFLVNLEIGYCTPPIGLNLFISSFRFNKSVVYLYYAVFPFLILGIITLLLITYLPWLSLNPLFGLGH